MATFSFLIVASACMRDTFFLSSASITTALLHDTATSKREEGGKIVESVVVFPAAKGRVPRAKIGAGLISLEGS